MRDDIDDILTLAFANQRQPEPPDVFKEEIASQLRSPLAALIDSYVEEHPHVEYRALLEQIGNLNQGQPEDLDRSDFQSYLIGRFRVSEVELAQARRALGTYRRMIQSQPGEHVQLAARDEAGTGACSATATEIQALFKKRKK